ncbi:MAG TPA: hypothetical protein VN706_06280 [Gemmatimonadaceae bacterium]|jgi:hypothetical protein|nr:hypothetical protein [Gemmatimonadaceae bacterium]
MRHCLLYAGGFERNFPKLQAGAASFEGTDGASHELPSVPAGVDGVRVSYMEKPGKKFCAVRVQSGKNDIVLKHEVLIDPPTHMGHGKRFGPEPTVVDDEPMAALLADIMAKNPEQQMQLANARAAFSVTGGKK